MKKQVLKVAGCLLVAAIAISAYFLIGHFLRPFTPAERRIIRDSDSLMNVCVLPADSAVLRAVSAPLGDRELDSPLLQSLIDKMLYTVQDPSQDGVGIAAPQVGISRHLVCVQRFDKPGEPFEAYPNIQIDSLLGEICIGPEGCLSVPGLRGMVPRYASVVISYVRPGDSTHKRISERVDGFTAVIFQHECDHLDGILYIDKATEIQARD